MEQPSEPVSNDSGSARLRVLEMIDEGSITAEEGLRLLQAFSAADVAAEAGDQVDFVAESAVLPLNDAEVLRQAEVPLEAEIPLPNGATTSLQPASIERVGITASQPEPSGESTVADQPAHAIQPADAEQPAHAKQPADVATCTRWLLRPARPGCRRMP